VSDTSDYMPRSRRRRKNDRSRDVVQRRIAAEALERAREADSKNLDRYVKAVYRPRAGETVMSKDGKSYLVQEDGSLRRKEGSS
jgi:hypothetical protein